MDYENSYGKTVKVKTYRDIYGNRIHTNLDYVITFYIDSKERIVGIFPLEGDGYTKDDVLSFQPKKHVVSIDDLEEVK